MNAVDTDQEAQAANAYDLAKSISTECKEAGSLASLDTAIRLLHGVLNLQLPHHHLRSDSLIKLSEALLTRFGRTGQPNDLDGALLLLGKMSSSLTAGGSHGTSVSLLVISVFILLNIKLVLHAGGKQFTGKH